MRMAVLAFAVQRFTAIMLCQKFVSAATNSNTALCWHAGQWGLTVFQCCQSPEDFREMDAHGCHSQSVIGTKGLD